MTKTKPRIAKLTKAACDRAKYRADEGARCVVWDSDLKGYGLRVFSGGAKSFVISYRQPGTGRKRLLTVGRFGELTPVRARTEASRMLLMVRDGTDPATARARATVPTFNDLADRYLRDHARPHTKRPDQAVQVLRKHLRPAFGKMAIDAITADDVRAMHARIGRRSKYSANRAVELLRAILNKGRRWNLLPAKHPNPAADVDRFREKSRTRWLTEREIGRLLRALDREDTETQAVVRLLLLTGARRGEILGARWDAIDLDARRLRLVETKSGEERIVPLSPEAVAIVRGLPRRLHSPWLFPSPKVDGAHIKDIKPQWARVRRRARLHDVRLHDLRRTTGSALINAGHSLEVVGKALGHRSLRSTQIYARVANEQATAALDTLGSAIGAVDAKRKRARRS
ncbi:MAG TPA: tyrosine-type recombinase/integrase [Longimicrobiales bacterium]|nr:tyrosine-type recombinase/integrase [Longimicrobiales bacterium]